MIIHFSINQNKVIFFLTYLLKILSVTISFIFNFRLDVYLKFRFLPLSFLSRKIIWKAECLSLITVHCCVVHFSCVEECHQKKNEQTNEEKNKSITCPKFILFYLIRMLFFNSMIFSSSYRLFSLFFLILSSSSSSSSMSLSLFISLTRQCQRQHKDR